MCNYLTFQFQRTIKKRAGERGSGRAGERASGRAGERASGRAGERASGRAGERASGRAGERASGRAGERASGRAGERASGRDETFSHDKVTLAVCRSKTNQYRHPFPGTFSDFVATTHSAICLFVQLQVMAGCH